MKMEHFYEVDLKWDHKRIGTLSSPDLNDNIEVATPPDFPEGVPGVWSPEHLFIASICSCLMTTFLAIADFSNLHYDQLSIAANGKLDQVDGRLQVSEVTLKPHLIVNNERDIKKGERILYKADKACLISNSITSKVIFKPKVEMQVLSEPKV